MNLTKSNYGVLLLALLASFVSNIVAGPIGTAFTYQGRLASGTNAANGIYDFSFALFDDANAGTQKGPTLTASAVPVTNGLFTVTLDFGSFFDGSNRWLAVSVKTNGAGSYTALTPRQPLTPTPYAVFASSLSSNVNQTFSGTVSFSPSSGPPFTVNSSTKVPNLNAEKLDGLDAGSFWQLGGNAGTTAGVNFLGTTDNQALELKVYGQRVVRLEPHGDNGTPNFIAGKSNNISTPAGSYQGISIGGGSSNTADDDYSTIGGGSANKISHSENFSDHATIGGGGGNQTVCQKATIGGGGGNSCGSLYGYDTIAGGSLNYCSGSYGAIGGGKQNQIRSDYPNSYYLGLTIAGGETNVIIASYGSIGGGRATLSATTLAPSPEVGAMLFLPMPTTQSSTEVI